MRGLHYIIVISLSFLLPAIIAQATEPQGVAITTSAASYYPSADAPKRYEVVDYSFHIPGGTNYVLSQVMWEEMQANGTRTLVSSNIGMPAPSFANWYHSGFLAIILNGKSVMNVPCRVEIVDSGARGMLDVTWDHPMALVRARFMAEAGNPSLMVEIRWEPKERITSALVRLTCYPQEFAVAEVDRLKGKTTQRVVTTALGNATQGKRAKINLHEEGWLLYKDLTMEASPVRALISGPCGLTLLPNDEYEKVEVDVSDYNVDTELFGVVDSGRLRFALWDFNNKSAVEAQKMLADSMVTLQQRMQNGAWAPTRIMEFDAAKERQRVAALGKALGAKAAPPIAALGQQIADIEKQKGALTGVVAIDSERKLREALMQYRRRYWQAERPTRKTVRTLLFAGPTAYAWQLEPIVRQAWGDDAVRNSAYIFIPWVKPTDKITYFPSTVDELLSYDVVVLADIPQDPFTPEQRQVLADYVKLGGGLLVLGGWYTYGAGNWKDSPLEPLLPVQLGEKPFDLVPCNAALALTGPGVKHFGKLPALNGVLLWRHRVAPRPNSEVWLTA
ncbi:MAG TPA: glutamine amidotransferase, partial [Armatimonadota bacterium]